MSAYVIDSIRLWNLFLLYLPVIKAWRSFEALDLLFKLYRLRHHALLTFVSGARALRLTRYVRYFTFISIFSYDTLINLLEPLNEKQFDNTCILLFIELPFFLSSNESIGHFPSPYTCSQLHPSMSQKIDQKMHHSAENQRVPYVIPHFCVR